MKINTKVIFEWDDESKQYEEVYCESYDYDGAIDKCQEKEEAAEWEAMLKFQAIQKRQADAMALWKKEQNQAMYGDGLGKELWNLLGTGVDWLKDIAGGGSQSDQSPFGGLDYPMHHEFGEPWAQQFFLDNPEHEQTQMYNLMQTAETDANPEAIAAYEKFISQGKQDTPEGFMRAGPGDKGLYMRSQDQTQAGEVPSVNQMYAQRLGNTLYEGGKWLGKGAIDATTKAIGSTASYLWEGMKGEGYEGGGLKAAGGAIAGGLSKLFGKEGIGSKALGAIGGGSPLAGASALLGAYSSWRGAKRQRQGLGKAISELNKPLAMYKTEYESLSKEADAYRPGGEYSQYAIGKTFDMAESGASKAVGELSARGIDSAAMSSQLARGAYSKAAENVPGVMMDVAKGGMMYDKLALGALGGMTQLHGDIAQLKGARGRIDPTQSMISSLGSSMFNIPMLEMMYKDKV